jgi:hypothetical protein
METFRSSSLFQVVEMTTAGYLLEDGWVTPRTRVTTRDSRTDEILETKIVEDPIKLYVGELYGWMQ